MTYKLCEMTYHAMQLTFGMPCTVLQDRRPIRPLDILCEAKVSAASPTFIKCSCEACTGGASSYSGGSFSSVPDFLAHGRSIFGPETVVVLAELELSWPVSWLRQLHWSCSGRYIQRGSMYMCMLCSLLPKSMQGRNHVCGVRLAYGGKCTQHACGV